jgi:hypothetical protein
MFRFQGPLEIRVVFGGREEPAFVHEAADGRCTLGFDHTPGLPALLELTLEGPCVARWETPAEGPRLLLAGWSDPEPGPGDRGPT